MNRKLSLAEVLWVVIGYFAFIGLLAVYNGFVLTKLWTWFVVPLGAPTITLAIAVGINLTVSFLTARVPRENEKWPRLIAFSVTYPAITLLFGYIVHLFT